MAKEPVGQFSIAIDEKEKKHCCYIAISQVGSISLVIVGQIVIMCKTTFKPLYVVKFTTSYKVMYSLQECRIMMKCIKEIF